MIVTKERLDMMQEDLKILITDKIVRDGLVVENLYVGPHTDRGNKKYNTKIEVLKPMNIPFKAYVHLDNTFDFDAVLNTAGIFVKRFYRSMDKDMTQLSILLNTVRVTQPDLPEDKALVAAKLMLRDSRVK